MRSAKDDAAREQTEKHKNEQSAFVAWCKPLASCTSCRPQCRTASQFAHASCCTVCSFQCVVLGDLAACTCLRHAAFMCIGEALSLHLLDTEIAHALHAQADGGVITQQAGNGAAKFGSNLSRKDRKKALAAAQYEKFDEEDFCEGGAIDSAAAEALIDRGSAMSCVDPGAPCINACKRFHHFLMWLCELVTQFGQACMVHACSTARSVARA